MKNRSKTDNIVEFEGGLHKNSQGLMDSAGLLLDFQTAFPSTGHDRIWEVLRRMEVPLPLLRLIQAFLPPADHAALLRRRDRGDHADCQRDQTMVPLVGKPFCVGARSVDQAVPGLRAPSDLAHVCFLQMTLPLYYRHCLVNFHRLFDSFPGTDPSYWSFFAGEQMCAYSS